MVKLRLMRMGRKKRPFYRIVAAQLTSPRDGHNLAIVGSYDPINTQLNIDEEAVILWLNRGAQMTETVKDLMKNQGVLARWKGLEGTVREDALRQDKPARRRKMATAAGASAESVVEKETPAPQEEVSESEA